MTQHDSEQFWRTRWQENATGWDLNGPHPLFEALLEELAAFVPWTDLRRWYVPGCGRAHDAAELTKRGAEVVATDIVPKAIEEARLNYSNLKRLDLRVENALRVQEASEIHTYNAIFDRAMLCALSGKERVAYVDACHKRLKVGGWFVSLPFAEVARPENGPPFQVSESELRQLFSHKWAISAITPRRDGAVDAKILAEFIFIARTLP